MIGVLEWFLLLIQWFHNLAAVSWVGGSIFYLLVLRPAFRRSAPGPATGRAIGEEFRSVVHTAIAILVITGVIVMVSNLRTQGISAPYVGVLVLKVSLAFYMFAVIWFRRRSANRREATTATSAIPISVPRRWARLRGALTGTTALLILGLVVFGLADVLGALGERGPGG